MSHDGGLTFDVLEAATADAVVTAIAEHAGRSATSITYLEFGVFQGHCLARAHEAIMANGFANHRIIGFDSFAGLPPPPPGEETGTWRNGHPFPFNAGDFACAEADVRHRLAAAGVGPDSVELVPGFFETSLTPDLRVELGLEAVDVVLVDVDFSSSTNYVLDFIRPLLQPGTAVLFDDWNVFGDRNLGERLALDEHIQAHPGLVLEPTFPFGWHGHAFTCCDA